MKKKIIIIIILVVVFLIGFGIWINLFGLAASGFRGSVNILEGYIVAKRSFPENLSELENFHGYEIHDLVINFSSIDKIKAKDSKLYLDGHRTWIVKPKGRTKLWLNVFSYSFSQKYSYEVYEKYREIAEN